jgi:DNA primase
MNKVKQYHKSTVTGLLGKNGEEKVNVIEELGLDADAFKIGWVSGQFHHRKDQEWMKPFVEANILIPANGNHKFGGTSYGCYGYKGYVIPLLNQEGEQVNLFAFYPNHQTKESEFLNDAGLFPRYPRAKTERLYILNDVISTASLIQSEALGNRDSAISLFNGEAKTQHYTAVFTCETLKELVFIGVSDEIIATYQEESPDLRILKVELPEGESMSDMLLTYDNGVEDFINDNLICFSTGERLMNSMSSETELSASQNSLIKINPQLHEYESEIGQFKILGSLPNNLGDLKVSLKLGKGQTYVLNASNFSKVNAYKSWLVKKYDIDSEIVEESVNDLIDEIETSVLDKINAYHDSIDESPFELTPKAKEQAIKELEKSNDVLITFNDLVGGTGLVGDTEARLMSLVIAISYRFKYQLHGIVQGSSGSGKTHLIKSVLKCLPSSEVIDLNKVSPNALYNVGVNQLENKLVVIEDYDGLKKDAKYAFRETQSSDSIKSMTVDKDLYGNLFAQVKTVNTGFASLMATTRPNIYYDNQSRSILIGVDESQEQTNRITEYENSIHRGEVDFNKQDEIRQSMSNMVQMLESYEVINPFAGKVILPQNADSYRRLNTQFNYFINVITLLNQHQRKTDKQGRLITEMQDVKQAIKIFYGCIKLKMDDLSTGERTFYERLKDKFPKDATKEPKFSRKEVESNLSLKKSVCSQYLGKLVKLDYLTTVGSANKGFKYQMVDRDDFKALADESLNKMLNQLDAQVA